MEYFKKLKRLFKKFGKKYSSGCDRMLPRNIFIQKKSPKGVSMKVILEICNFTDITLRCELFSFKFDASFCSFHHEIYDLTECNAICFKVKIHCECLKSLTYIFKTYQVLFLKHS